MGKAVPERWAPGCLDDGAWFHGSPLRLEVLAAGSTVTRSRAVAEAFSHKPTCVGIEEGPDAACVCQNGQVAGLLYVVDEPISAADVRPHPSSTYRAGLEWLTTRPLRLRLVARLSAAEPGCRADCPHRGSAGARPSTGQ